MSGTLPVPWPTGAGYVIAAMLGLIFGSFANVCIHRIPERRSVVWPGSACTNCGKAIAWYDNIPVLSWLILGGKCRECATPISFQYPLVEALTALILVGLCFVFGLTLKWAALSYLSISILILIPIDYRLGILPDRVTLTGLAAGLLVSPFLDEPGFVRALMGAATGAAVPLAIRAIYMVYAGRRARRSGGELSPEHREGMGLGDVKMLAMVGAFLGPQKVLLTIVLGSFLGTLTVIPLILMRRLGTRVAIPFGPFLGVAALIAVFFGSDIIDWYLGFTMPE